MDQLTVPDPVKSNTLKSNTWHGWIAPWSYAKTSSQDVRMPRWGSSLIGKLRRSS
jgi:hypothetical protein